MRNQTRIIPILILLVLNNLEAFDPLVTTVNSALALAGRANNVALGNNVSSILYNPASLVYVDSTEFLASFTLQTNKNYLADLMTAFPLSIGRDISVAINAAYYCSSESLLNAGLALSAQFNFIKAGLYGSYLWNPQFPMDKGSFIGKAGILLTPFFLKLGLVLENTTINNETALLLRTQAAYRFKSIKLSAGFSRVLKEDNDFIFNAGFDWQPLDWFGLVFNFEDMQISGGFTLSSLRTTFYFGTLYIPAKNLFDLSISICYNS